MATSLYDLSVGSYLQTLAAARGFLDKGLKHCAERGVDPETIVETRLIADMEPFRFQVQQIARHSAGAIDGLQAGQFLSNQPLPQLDYAGLQALLAEAEARLLRLTPAEVDAYEDRVVLLPQPTRTPRFETGVDFILSCSLPNFYFHTATAYGILRQAGVPIGKRDFLGAMRMTL